MDIAALKPSLTRASELAAQHSRSPRWRPGLPCALHNEVFAPAREASGAGAALAFAMDGLRVAREADRQEERSVLWVQDAGSIKANGRPYRPGLPKELRHRLVHVAAATPEDALFALEEGLRCRDLACVIGEIAGNPRALDFTASRRLSLTAENHGVPLYLVRHDARRDLGSARMRWQVASAISPPPLWNRDAPGRPTWHAELFRARAHAPGQWILRHEPDVLSAERATTPDPVDLAGAAGA